MRAMECSKQTLWTTLEGTQASMRSQRLERAKPKRASRKETLLGAMSTAARDVANLTVAYLRPCPPCATAVPSFER